MADARRPRLPVSRRALLTAAAATPAITGAGAGPRSVAELAKAWNAERDLIALLTRRWSDLETALQRRTGSLDFRAAAAAGDAGALEMIAIDRRVPGLWETAEAASERISRLPCTTLSDALAKVQMGIRIIGPHDSEGASYALLQGGYDDLVRMLGPLAGQ
ncbi:hypothetical protein [Phenylobacterium sp.]|uniref:hypothetical protein n=1 Tax=Phenylobacterium sp. TaxID=1871053 RepID=UPI0035C78C03